MAPRKLRNQLDNRQLEVFRDITDDVIEADFVPYACLFDPDTVLTKNGELLQIIKITGFTYEAVSMEDADLRNVIRGAVLDCIDSDEYAVWFHTIRRKKRLSPDADYPDPFSAQLHEAWKRRNEWDRKYINELYVTVVKEGQDADIASVSGFIEGLIPARDRKKRNRFLDRIAVELQETVDQMLHVLKDFGAKRLTVVERDGIYYGEHIEFLEKLINLEERPMPIKPIGLSEYLAAGELSFAYNAMEVRTAEGERRFGAVLTVKEYKEASLYRIDEILQLPCEFIVSQCIDFVNTKRALQSYEGQQYYLRLSSDTELADATELTEVLASNHQGAIDFGEQQTSIFVIGFSVSEMERALKSVRDALSKIGIVTIREDLKFEECYWAQLPANFEFICRLGYTNTSHVAGFVNIHNYPAGNAKGCPWGPPATLFYTAAGTPYFFNFHLGENGHTTIIGTQGSGKEVMTNFLISMSRKYKTRLFYIDATGKALSFISALQGNYFDLGDKQEAAGMLSPLSLPDTNVNREFLAFWLTTLIDETGMLADEKLIGLFRGAINHLYTLPKDQRTLQNVHDQVTQQDAHTAKLLTKWFGAGEYAHLFDSITERMEPKNGIIGFNVSGLIANSTCYTPVSSYLLHRITMTLDGAPSIFVLDEAWRLLNNPLFAPRIGQWLQYLTSKNALAIMTTGEVEALPNYEFAAQLTQAAATQIYLPNEDPDDFYIDTLGMSEDEFAYLDAMNVDYRHFMIKRANESVVAELNIGGMDYILSVLSGEHKENSELLFADVAEEEEPVKPNQARTDFKGWQ